MNERAWTCPNCGKYVFLSEKSEQIDKGVTHHYYECDYCSEKVTIYYSDNRLRKMIKKQSKETNIVIKQANERNILERMTELRKKYE
ncbi:hypothetical protein [Enterococcus sp. 5H]|uniref:hypothetical protein n=1 Tax=Enterococcus sp. 5H TaxID=1229490 RepID=UPI002302285A|nr:hypothetical protein [Enterococcus sp. 5H]MDA9472650.1 hypothetical protein [Enterococcus sp. 5H]